MSTPRYEPERLRSGPFALALIVLAVVMALITAVVGWTAGGMQTPPLVEGPVHPSMAPLQTHAPEDLAALRAREDERLNGTFWISRERGIVSVPVSRAMDLV